MFYGYFLRIFFKDMLGLGKGTFIGAATSSDPEAAAAAADKRIAAEALLLAAEALLLAAALRHSARNLAVAPNLAARGAGGGLLAKLARRSWEGAMFHIQAT